MPLIRDGRLVDDPWVTLDEEAPLPAHRPVIVPLARWQAERHALLARGPGLGVRLGNDQPVDPLLPDLAAIAVIALVFPKFTDGRAYSQARLLRQRHGYQGEIRATGNVLRDQLLFMHRCGFDAFEVTDARALEGWLQSMGEIGVFYQPAADGRGSALRRRLDDRRSSSRLRTVVR